MLMRNEQDTAVVEIRRVSKSFRSPEGSTIHAVSDLSLSIPAGQFTTLLGPSGCGKTTLLRMIGGFEEPNSGSVLIDGVEMTYKPPYERPVNTVFQQYALFPHMTAAENIGYGLSVAGVSRSEISRRVSEALELVRLADFGSRSVRKMSGGQQQRVALARALILRPKILLLDEPLAALDRRLRKDMQFELKKLQHELGIAFLCVTHDQEEALAMSDQVVVMNRGRIEQIGTPWDVYQKPKTRFTAGFVGEMNFLPAVAQSTDGSQTKFETGDGTSLFAAASDAVAGRSYVLALRPEQLRVTSAPPAVGLEGRVVESIYLGTSTRVEVQAAGCTIQAAFEGGRATWVPGETIHLAYEPSEVLVLTP
jgi:spermidine/putrescine transport system ATP-binding protein